MNVEIRGSLVRTKPPEHDFVGSEAWPVERFLHIGPASHNHNSRVGGGALTRWPPSAAQTARADWLHAAFTKSQRRREDREGIKSSKRTRP